nr:GxxExxY protein [Luteimonas gilva]
MHADKTALIEGELTDRVIGSFYAVYNELGHGFLESVYENALAIALRDVGLQVQTQACLTVQYRGHIVGDFKATFWSPKKSSLSSRPYRISCQPMRPNL